MNELRFRQIHLDFHTSEKIPNVGSDFDPAQFGEMLRRGHVNSITLFSKCHHGLTYHDTAVGVRHPGMDAELLPRQMEVCKSLDVNTPIYLSAGIDEASLRAHPEWAYKDITGLTYEPLRAGFQVLCFNTPYLDYLCAQVEEVIDKFDGGDGLFLDIVTAPRCYCQFCLTGMQEHGYDPLDLEAVDEYQNKVVLQKYYERTTAAARKKNAELRIFHNGGHIPKGAYQIMRWDSHLELESLPTGGWGYDHFPVSAKYAATTGFDFLGMTGKFHMTWGEFGGFKRADALRYECSAMLAYGAKCGVGDQLHPNGVMNPDTYALIGEAYREVEEKEPWCRGAKAVSEVAILAPESLHSDKLAGRDDTFECEEGAARMLLEAHIQFDVIDLSRDFSLYRLLILPDVVTLDEKLAARLQGYIDGGGKVLLSGRSGLTPAEDGFALDFGAELVGRSEWNPDYLICTVLTPSSPVRGPFVIHGGAWDVQPKAGGSLDILARRARPFFNRTWDHFCSHRHTPDERESPFAGAIGNTNVVYFAHEIFTRYRIYGQPIYRDLVVDAIRHLLGSISFEACLPSAARTSLMRQEDEKRYVLHLLYAVPMLRATLEGFIQGKTNVEIIEDIVPLYNVECTLRLPEKVRGVRLVPGGQPLEWTESDGAIIFTVPKIDCHQMVEIT